MHQGESARQASIGRGRGDGRPGCTASGSRSDRRDVERAPGSRRAVEPWRTELAPEAGETLATLASRLRSVVRGDGPLVGGRAREQQYACDERAVPLGNGAVSAPSASADARASLGDVTDLVPPAQTHRGAVLHAHETLATLAHELRGALAPIPNALHLLQTRPSSAPSAKKARDLIDRRIRHAGRLIDDLLDVGRITTGKLELRCETVDLTAIVTHAVEAMQARMRQMSHRLRISLPDSTLYLRGDPVRLDQVFVNLLENACKYTEPGGTIWLAVERDDDQAVVRITDTGIGIAPERIPGLFELFEQCGAPSHEAHAGLGVGLWLVRALLERHGGSIDVRSDGRGLGSEFTVQLPLCTDALAAEPTRSSQGARTAEDAAQRILIADDDAAVLRSTALLLRAGGHEVVTARGGVEALETAERYRPDVMILDIRMPWMDGRAVGTSIRERAWAHEVLMIALTGAEDDCRGDEGAPFDAHVLKPFDPERLLMLVGGRATRATRGARVEDGSDP